MLSMVEEALVIEFRRRKLTCPHKNGLSVMRESWAVAGLVDTQLKLTL